jgi:hypothetical protein
MTTLFSHASTTSAVVTKVSEIPSTITPQVQRQVDRLAASLAASDPGGAPKCALMMEIGEGKDSSLWLATAVAAVLGAKIKQNVHVLSIEGASRSRRAAKRHSMRFAGSRNFTFEQVENLPADRGRTSAIEQRLASLRAANQPVIVYLAQDQDLADLLPSAHSIDGVVLLVRASRARRAALFAAEHNLLAAGLKFFGCVLLDRTYPIPSMLYRLL